MFHGFHKTYTPAQQFSTLIIIRNGYWAENKNISMISEESCKAEDWSNEIQLWSQE